MSLRRILDDTLPRLILDDQRLTPTNKLVYIGLRSHPKSTIVHNATVLKMPYETVRWSVRRLIKLGWAYSFPHPKTGRDIIVPWMPLDVEVDVARQAEYRSGLVPNKGEWLMKGYLDLFVDDKRYEDNARPAWAVSGSGSGRLEFDRLYFESKVAIEFQGRQHYEEVTFADGRKSNLMEQQARDALKAMLCMRQQIAFVEIPATELSYGAIIAKLDGILPLIPPLMDRPLFQCLQNLCRGYVNSVHGKKSDG